MPCMYDSKKVIPAPIVTVAKDYQFKDDGTPIGGSYVISVKGKLLSYKGSPNAAGTLWTGSGYPPDDSLTNDERLKSILKKQDALRKLFSEHGKSFEIQPWDGTQSTKFNPRIKRIEFAEGPWHEYCDYVITMEADRLYLNGTPIEATEFDGYYVSRASEEWNIEVLDVEKKTYRLTHSVSATGKTMYEPDGSIAKKAWERAKDYVVGSIGLGLVNARLVDTTLIGGTTNLKAYNYLRTQSTGESTGIFSVSETWVCYDPGSDSPATEDWSINIRESLSEPGRTNVSVEGTITGLEERNTATGALVSTRYTNAKSKFDNVIYPAMFTRAQDASGLSLNSIATNRSVGINELFGTITYHYEYDNRPSATVPDALTEMVKIQYNNASDIFASIPIPGRSSGPLLQDLFTKSSKKKSIHIEVQMPAKRIGFTPTEPNTDQLVLENKPSGTQVFLENDVVNWDGYTGRYTRDASYEWQ